ncbi:hypothetical protein GA0115233_106261 [Streptomyces sp. DI166]|uniref:hypothetical protein n=1 Tax=Streptomyces sp. DI166 TaxID=1839783 RepID=UPI0007F3A73C|nr:hypothetical protein [Streptomyces sp. DI166]SBT93383.1 hypothetical protein GA0115233_106261 [Streptomyces sp. DI166]
MTAYLIDEAPEGWSILGTDLLEGAPDALREHLAGGRNEPGRRYPAHPTLPPFTWTERTASQLSWGYVLHPQGIEVISAPSAARGPVVAWATDPRTRFRDTASLRAPDRPIPASIPPKTTAHTAPPGPTPSPIAAVPTRPRAH